MDFQTPEQRLKEEIERVLNTHFMDLERKRIVLTCMFDGRMAMVAPEDYPAEREDIPVFTYKELKGLYDHGNRQMFNNLYDIKSEFKNAKATGVRKKTIAGGFEMP